MQGTADGTSFGESYVRAMHLMTRPEPCGTEELDYHMMVVDAVGRGGPLPPRGVTPWDRRRYVAWDRERRRLNRTEVRNVALEPVAPGGSRRASVWDPSGFREGVAHAVRLAEIRVLALWGSDPVREAIRDAVRREIASRTRDASR